MKNLLERFFGKNKKAEMPEMYTEKEVDTIEAHITKHFGKFEKVFHEIVSPDIHVDIAIIPPCQERDYYILVTMGMGAHRMNVPKELSKQKLNRAEMIICLPPDWKIGNDSEEWYWPLRWLKIMARLPIEQNTWLGWGHTVPNGEPFAENTKLSGMVVSLPEQFDEKSFICAMPGRSRVIFYHLVPLYDEEMDYKLQNDAEALFEKMGNEMMTVININRKNTML